MTHDLNNIPDFPGIRTVTRVVSKRQVYRAFIIECSTETRYYVCSLIEPLQALADRIRGYWGSRIRCIMFEM